MTKTIMKCDRCGVEVQECLLKIPNPSYSGSNYYPENVPFSVYPRNFELCIECADKLIHNIRKFCKGGEFIND